MVRSRRLAACVSEVLEQRQMRSSNVYDDGLGHIVITNDDLGHKLELGLTANNKLSFKEDGVMPSGALWDQSYIKSVSIFGNGGDDVMLNSTFAINKTQYAPVGLFIDGGDGNDSIVGGCHNDTIFGGAGNDTISGATGTDLIFGQDGDDLFIASNGKCDVYGGDGNDTTDSSNAVTSATISLDDVANDSNGLSYICNFHSDIENVTTGKSPDLVTGSSADNIILTGKGNDTIYAGDGNDTLDGGDGADKVYGEAGNDVFLNTGDIYKGSTSVVDSLYGGDGDDYFFGTDGFKDVIDGGAGDDTVDGYDALDVITNVETII